MNVNLNTVRQGWVSADFGNGHRTFYAADRRAKQEVARIERKARHTTVFEDDWQARYAAALAATGIVEL